jgi:hypothetical protein
VISHDPAHWSDTVPSANGTTPAGPEHGVRQRTVLPALSFNLWAALGGTALAGAGVVAALSLSSLPTPAFSIILFTVAPLCALVALVVVAVRNPAEGDPALAWVAVGLAVCCLALLLQLVSFPTVTTTGGLLGTSGEASAQLYLTFHVWIFGCCLAAALGASTALLAPALWVGLLVAVVQAVNAFPSPHLLTSAQVFTPALIRIELVLTAVGVVVVLAWSRASGRYPTPLRGWVGVSLVLTTYELALNAAAGRRYQAFWWASVSLRAAAFATLAGGCVGYVLRQAGRLEQYSSTELGLRESELRGSVLVTERLLAHARELARSRTPDEVARALCTTARLLTGVDRVTVGQLNAERRAMEPVATLPDLPPHLRAGRLPGVQGLPGPATSLYLQTRAQIEDGLPETARPDDSVAALAVLALRVGELTVGVLLLESERPRDWSAADRDLVQGLADQAGPVLSRARLAAREHEAAETLQRSLLPQQLPVVDGLDLLASYQPAVREDRVGGDWYDGWTLPDGRVALVVGDVVGKGLAAAGASGRLRASLRALADTDPSPGHVLTRLDQLEADPCPGMVATVVYVLFEADLARFRIASAGHLPAIVVAPGRPAALVDGGSGVPIGVGMAGIDETSCELPPGGALMLYTDGLVEDRTHAIDERLAALLEVVSAGFGALGPGGLLRQLMSDFRSRDDDDVAVLLASRVPRTPQAVLQARFGSRDGRAGEQARRS